MERDSVEEVRGVRLAIALAAICPSILRADGMKDLPPDAVEVSGEGTYYLERKDNLSDARSMAVEIARSNAIDSAFGTAFSSTAQYQAYETTDGGFSDSFYSLMRSVQTGIWVRDLEEPEVTSFMDEDASFGFKAKVRGLVRPLMSMPVETIGRVFVGKGKDADHGYETSTLRRGDEFYFGFKAASDGFLAVYVVDEDENVCKAAPIGRNSTPLRKISAEKETILRDEYLKNIAEISRPESREVYNRVVYVFSPSKFTLPLSEDADPATGMPPVMDLAKFHTWLQDMAVADPRFTVSWQTISIRR